MSIATNNKQKSRSSTPRVKPTQRKRLFDLDMAEACANQIVEILAPACALIMVAGSIRRRARQVHDIDIVLYPIVEHVGQLNLFDPAALMVSYPRVLFETLRLHDWAGYSFGNYPRVIRFDEYHGIPVELYLAEPDGQNFYALLQARTGSTSYNMSLVQRAGRMGLNYRVGHGIYNGQTRVDDGTEAGIWRALGLDYIDPEQRA